MSMNKYRFECEWYDYSITTRYVWAASYSEAVTKAKGLTRKGDYMRRLYDDEGYQVL